MRERRVYMNSAIPFGARMRGVTLVELIISIVIIGVALAGVLVVIVRNTQTSADPMVWRQSVAIAEAYLGEILAKPFTDPDGSNVGETRATFDDVFDYNGLTEAPTDQRGIAVGALAAYTVRVTVTAADLNGTGVANAALVQVTVTPPVGGNITIGGYCTNHDN
jgi:MSHA pilin protein MshD